MMGTLKRQEKKTHYTPHIKIWTELRVGQLHSTKVRIMRRDIRCSQETTLGCEDVRLKGVEIRMIEHLEGFRKEADRRVDFYLGLGPPLLTFLFGGSVLPRDTVYEQSRERRRNLLLLLDAQTTPIRYLEA
jgi:hypothetical protein